MRDHRQSASRDSLSHDTATSFREPIAAGIIIANRPRDARRGLGLRADAGHGDEGASN